eukprot:CAMPEP_0114116944 /NCGR_PEP_ID=MMETSP0043_2-20121206/4767_1 /TAXON_ID=464988 /ORGANISM="Hemiselmis andersenii, Strain CCMP644" /LENGTH=89 /DNA_ID=CAMNT_0001209297 /DNA_START=22 /DNA_END=293 /DNA_ORIENTATION=-
MPQARDVATLGDVEGSERPPFADKSCPLEGDLKDEEPERQEWMLSSTSVCGSSRQAAAGPGRSHQGKQGIFEDLPHQQDAGRQQSLDKL